MMDGKEKPTGLMDDLYKYRVIFISLGIFVIYVALLGIWNQGVAIDRNTPSEEKCQSFKGAYSMFAAKEAARLYCSYNETGWHFNKTWYESSLAQTTP